MSNAGHVSGKVAVVTGGARGIRTPDIGRSFMGLLPVPWVVSAAGEGGALTTEAEHGQGDEGLGAVESVCHAGDEPYLGID
jgi:hypothetical protein